MTDTPDTTLDLLRHRESVLDIEFRNARMEVELANARLTEIRELIEKLTPKKRGRPRKEDSITTTSAVYPSSVQVTETETGEETLA